MASPSGCGGAREGRCGELSRTALREERIAAFQPSNLNQAEMFTDADTFTLELEQNLSVEQKANMIGSSPAAHTQAFEWNLDQKSEIWTRNR